MSNFIESVIDDAELAWLENLGNAVKHLPAPHNVATRQASGPEIAPGEFLADRTAVVAKNATSEFNSNMQKMHIAVSKNATLS